jgi:hypothetical protein
MRTHVRSAAPPQAGSSAGVRTPFVRPHQETTRRGARDRGARGAHAGIDDDHVDGAFGIAAPVPAERAGCIGHAPGRQVVRHVVDDDVRRSRGDHALHRADEAVARPEVGEERDAWEGHGSVSDERATPPTARGPHARAPSARSPAGPSGSASTVGRPRSPALATAASSGTRPRKGTAHLFGQPLAPTVPEDVGGFAAVGAGPPRHVLDHAEHARVHALEHLDAAADVAGRNGPAGW